MWPYPLMGRPKLSWDVPTQRMSGTQNGTGELQKSLAAGSGKWEIWLHSRWYPRTWGLNLKWKAVTCKVSHQFPMNIAALQCRPSMLSSTSMNSRIHLVNVGMLAYILTSQHPFVLPLNQSSHFVCFLSCQIWYPYRYGLKYQLLFKSLN